MLCQAFSFKHLPMAGGIFDQNPDMLDRFMYVIQKQEERRRKEENERERKQGGPTPRNKRVAGRR